MPQTMSMDLPSMSPTTDSRKTLNERLASLPLWVWFVVAVAALLIFTSCIIFLTICCCCCFKRKKKADVPEETQRRESVCNLMDDNGDDREAVNLSVQEAEAGKEKKTRSLLRWDSLRMSWSRRSSRRRVSTFKPHLYANELYNGAPGAVKADDTTKQQPKQEEEQVSKPIKKGPSTAPKKARCGPKHPPDPTIINKYPWQGQPLAPDAIQTKQSGHEPAPNSSGQPACSNSPAYYQSYTPTSYSTPTTSQYQLHASPNYNNPMQHGNSDIYPSYGNPQNGYPTSYGSPEGYSNPSHYAGPENHHTAASDVTADSANGFSNPLFEMKEQGFGSHVNYSQPAQSQPFRYSKAKIRKFSQGN